MNQIIEINGIMPKMGKGFYIAPGAFVIGDVVFGDQCSVWFNAVVRGDVNFIRIGHQTNIQDGAIIHGTYKKAGTTIGNKVTISHGAIVHGCTIKDYALIGMGAIVMDHCIIEEGCIVAAGSVVLENSVCEKGYIYAGTPSRKIKKIEDSSAGELVSRGIIADKYVNFVNWYRAENQ